MSSPMYSEQPVVVVHMSVTDEPPYIALCTGEQFTVATGPWQNTPVPRQMCPGCLVASRKSAADEPFLIPGDAPS